MTESTARRVSKLVNYREHAPSSEEVMDSGYGTHALLPWETWQRVVEALKAIDGVQCNLPEWWYEYKYDEVVRQRPR